MVGHRRGVRLQIGGHRINQQGNVFLILHWDQSAKSRSKSGQFVKHKAEGTVAAFEMLIGLLAIADGLQIGGQISALRLA